MVDTVRTYTDLLTNVFQNGQTAGITAQDLRDLVVSAMNVYQAQYTTGYADLLAPFSAGKVPAANAPTWTAFQPGASGNLFQYAFAIDDYIFPAPFHVNHDVKPNGNAYFHMHWTTNGATTDANTVKWEIEYSLALGHDQAAFSTPTTITVEQAMSATPYQHMVIETATPITLVEPDILIITRVKRITNGGTDNADTVFGLNLDLHYEVDRQVTKNKTPNFYT